MVSISIRRLAMATTTAFKYSPLPLPASANPKYLGNYGRRVEGVDFGNLTAAQTDELVERLYRHSILLFKNTKLTPKEQFELTNAFDPKAGSYGHKSRTTKKDQLSILHPDLKTIPHQPQVQLIGNGKVPGNHEGLESPQLKHPHHKTFHKHPVSEADDAAGVTRFYRWHIDAALYDLSPPKATSLYAVSVPQGPKQTLRYDDGTGDELKVPLGGTCFVSGKNMFEILPPEYKSLAVRSRVEYAPHPYVWMSSAHALPTGLGIESEGLELPLEELPEWQESGIKRFPVCWKNPITGELHFQVHPCGARKLHISPLPSGASKEGALYPDGAVLDDLKEVRDLLYKMQRPAIAPEMVYPVDWEEGDLVLFHNRGNLHSVTGAFKPDELRMFHQCNLASTDEPEGPSPEDLAKYA